MKKSIVIKKIHKSLKFIWHIPRKILVLLITGYQKTFSPDHGVFKYKHPYGYCKFYPTCSDYAKKTIAKEGVIWGSLKSLWRILRCNPCSKGGVDPA